MKLVKKTTATTYSLHAERDAYEKLPSGRTARVAWALATVNDATGELGIQSDFGNWSYRWNTDHIGCPTLTDFLRDISGADYLHGKLLGSRDRENFDAQETVVELRRWMVERYGEELWTKHDVVEMWNDLWDLVDCNSAELFMERLPYGTYDLVTDCPHEHLVFQESFDSEVLRHIILPSLIAALQPEITAQPEAPAQAEAR